MTIIPPHNISEEKKKQILEELLTGKKTEEITEEPVKEEPQQNEIIIKDKSDRFEFYNIPPLDRTVYKYNIALCKRLLDKGRKYDQETWIDDTHLGISQGTTWEIPSAIDYANIIHCLSTHRRNTDNKHELSLVSTIQNFLKDIFEEQQIATRTRVWTREVARFSHAREVFETTHASTRHSPLKKRSSPTLRSTYLSEDHPVATAIFGGIWVPTLVDDMEWLTGEKPYLKVKGWLTHPKEMCTYLSSEKSKFNIVMEKKSHRSSALGIRYIK